MKNKFPIILSFLILWSVLFVTPAYALSARHHVYNMGRSLVKAIAAPFKGALVTGPRNIRETWRYEVHNREQPELRGKLRYKLFALWRAPGDEIKAVIDGAVESADHTGTFLKEFLSIFFSD